MLPEFQNTIIEIVIDKLSVKIPNVKGEFLFEGPSQNLVKSHSISYKGISSVLQKKY